ncbi:MAG: CPBP family intramembrane metalloprotease [Deltaproteobacteria bacterium]|nr:CPBP family intramembrane metalloprotease [Deltaproteobacteria bacterium]
MGSGDAPARSRRSVAVEVLVVLLGVEAVTLAAVLLPELWPAVGPYQGVIIALAFLYAPALGDRFTRELSPPVVPGAGLRSLSAGLLLAAVVLPLFAAGNHLWQRGVWGRELRIPPGGVAEVLRDWPAEWEGRPPSTGGPEPLVWVDRGLLVVANPPSGPAGLRLRWEPAAGSRAQGRRVALDVGDLPERGAAARSPAPLAPGDAVVLSAREVASLTLEGAAVIRCGATAAERDAPRDLRPGWTWWLWILASQVVLIALPEEVFYRGWLQQRLRRLWPGGVPVLGVRVGAAILVTSALFALGHVLTLPATFRLAVFFPSILFGWLRDRTGHLAGSVVFHVLSNLAMLTVMRFYF